MNMKLSQHAEVRCQQRGIHLSDLEIAVLFGKETPRGYFITKKGRRDAEQSLKHLQKQISRMEGKLVAIKDDTITTVFHATSSQQKQLLKR